MAMDNFGRIILDPTKTYKIGDLALTVASDGGISLVAIGKGLHIDHHAQNHIILKSVDKVR